MYFMLSLPPYGKYKKLIKTIHTNNQEHSISVSVKVSDETRRLRHIWVKNLLLKHIRRKHSNVNYLLDEVVI